MEESDLPWTKAIVVEEYARKIFGLSLIIQHKKEKVKALYTKKGKGLSKVFSD